MNTININLTLNYMVLIYILTNYGALLTCYEVLYGMTKLY